MPRFRTMRTIVKSFLFLLAIGFGLNSSAQDIHFTQFNMSPLTLNPANTGGHDGLWRANAIYRNQWNSVTVPFITFGGSFDAPIMKALGDDNFLAAGVQFFNDQAGDGNLQQTAFLASLAYHLTLDDNSKTRLSLGLQGGYHSMSIDLQNLYWGDEFFNGGFQPGTTGEFLDPKHDYFTANVGLKWSHNVSDKISYFVGGSAFNLNQPRISFLTKANNEVGLDIRLDGQAGLIWNLTEQLQLKPAVMYQTQSSAQELVAGMELRYVIDPSALSAMAPAVFIGGYTRMDDQGSVLATAGLEYKSFRLGVGYDYMGDKENLGRVSNYGGFEIALQYIMPNELQRFRNQSYPCARF